MWKKILQNFSSMGYHHLQDYQPEVLLEHKWTRAQPVSSFSQNDWERGITLNEIMCVATLCIWQEEKLEWEAYSRLRQGEAIYVGCIFDDYVQVKLLTKFTVEDHYMLFHSSDRQKLRIMCGMELKMEGVRGLPITEPVKIKEVDIFIIARGPHREQCTTVRGKGKLLVDIPYDGVLYHCRQERTDDQVDIPHEIYDLFFQLLRRAQPHADFLDQAYYQGNHPDYTLWTFSSHTEQVKSIIKNLEPTVTVVAPGDGCGIVAAQWPGDLVAGDLYFESDKVKKESFLQTMVRGRRRNKAAVLVLSYVTSLMTEIELHSCNNWPGPVIWIDSIDFCPIFGMTHISRNVYCRGITPRVRIPTLEVNKPKQWSEYTENLMALESICYINSVGPAVQYWRQMRPLGHCVQWAKGMKSPIVCSTLQNYIEALFKTHNPAYFAPLGLIMDRPQPVRLSAEMTFSYRQIYMIPLSNPWASVVKEAFTWIVTNKNLIFFQPRQEGRVFELVQQKEHIKWTFVIKSPYRTLCEVVSHTNKTLYLHTIWGLVDIPFYHEGHYDILEPYLDAYSQNDWKKKIDKNLLPAPPDIVKFVESLGPGNLSKQTAMSLPPAWSGYTRFSSFDVWEG